MLQPRTFAFALLVGAFGLLAATMTINYALDPQYVFGTPLTRLDDNANYRYHRVREYQAKRDRVDGLLFASSRGRAFDAALLADKIGARAVAKFDVTAGMITDHLPALEYVMRDKAARGEKIRAALLLLDIDTFGKLPATNVNIDSFLPPELSGEHPARFWWRYLTVFQLRMWRGIIAYRVRGGDRADKSSELLLPRAPIELHPETGILPPPTIHAAATDPAAPRLLVATRPNLLTHLLMVSRFAELCRTNGIALTVATTPMRADAVSLHDPEDLRHVVRRLSEIVPIWDFGAPPRVAANIAYWDDPSHFKPTVAAMMLERMFGPNPPEDFGVLRQAKPHIALKR
ncbi:MAG: hypothetical protein WCE79_11645 [Xanthobacteraceae bacterium]